MADCRPAAVVYEPAATVALTVVAPMVTLNWSFVPAVTLRGVATLICDDVPLAP